MTPIGARHTLKLVQDDEIWEKNWSLQQGFGKIVASDTCLPKNAAKRPNCDLFVKRHNANFVITPQRNMAAALSGLVKSNALKRPDNLTPRMYRQLRHVRARSP